MSTAMPPIINSPSSLGGQAEAAVRELQQRLHSTRLSQISQRIGIGVCSLLAIGAVCLAVSATADWILELATVWRAAWLVGSVTTAATVAIISWQRWVAAYTLSDTAIDAEQRLSQFGQRLRTTLDYEQQVPPPAAASPSLLNSLHTETRKLAEQTEWSDAVDRRPLVRTVLVASAVALGWMAALILVPEFRIAAARAMLLPFDYTVVTFSPQSETVRPGESVTITVAVTGRPITSARIRHRLAGSQADWVTVDLVPPDRDERETPDKPSPEQLSGELSAVLDELEQDTEFEVLAGPRSLPAGFIRVLQPLTLQKSEALITPPAYTGRPAETVAALDVKVLEGSTVHLTLELNRAASEAQMTHRLRPTESKTAADEQAANATTSDATVIPLVLQDNVLRATLADLRTSVSFTVSARTADDMLLDPVRISIQVQPDSKPTIQFIEPAEELVVTPTTDVPMIVEAGDDLGLHKVGVMYQVGSGPMQTLIEETANGSSETFRLSSMLMLENHRLTHQDAVTYYAFAEDNYFGQPRRATTALRFIDIRPYKLQFQVVDQPGGGSCNGSVTLEELITRQRQGLSQAFQAQQEPTKETALRLGEAQKELLDATIEFAAGLADLGADVPMLDDAANHMQAATKALEAIELPQAVSAEQQALAALIRARENMRQKLNQSSSPSASACRKFDRQQRQKLRLPEKKKSDQQQQLSQARQKLDDLAKRERQWSQQAQQSCSNPGSSSEKQESGVKSQESASNPGSSSGKPSLKQETDSNPEQPDSPSAAELAAAQEKMQAELAEIQQQLQKLPVAGQAAREQSQQAAESMKQGLAELNQRNGEAAAREGERSAEQLEQLSAHLAAMNARDFGQRLDQAQKLAEKLAGRQEGLEQQLRERTESKPGKDSSGPKPGQQGDGDNATSTPVKDNTGAAQGSQPGVAPLARDQQALAVQAGLLAELLDGLKRDANKESGGVQQRLEQATTGNPPRDIATAMRQTADDLQGQRIAAAGRGAKQSRQRLQDLSKSLGAARGEYAQPQLKELLALEEQLAQLQQQMKRAQGKGDDSAAGLKWQQLEPRLDKMANSDQRLAEAMRQLREGPPEKTAGSKGVGEKPGEQDSSSSKSDTPGSTLGGKTPPKPGSQLKPTQFAENGEQITPEGFYSWLELGDFSGVREVSKAVQSRIQEAILAGALMDADQPVPPAYKELVEKYYRALSDDLR